MREPVYFHHLLPVGLSTLLGLSLAACSGERSSSSDTTQTGGAPVEADVTGGTSAVAGGASVGVGGSGGRSLTGSGGGGAAGGQVGSGGSAVGGPSDPGGTAGIGGSDASTGGTDTGGNSGTGGRRNARGGSTATGGATPSGGSTAAGGSTATASGGSTVTASGGSTVTASGGSTATASGGSTATGGSGNVSTLEKFSFFVTSEEAIVRLAGSDGFGGDLRYGEADGLSGADKICTEIAEDSMPGSGAKVWRAFLSVTAGPDGEPVNAIDRVGEGPWYDRMGRLVAMDKASLVATRPQGADPEIANDLPNEFGVPNHAPDGVQVDNHDTLTGSDEAGQLGSNTKRETCNDWTSAVGSTGQPRIGHAWPRGNQSSSWISAHTAPGCAPGINTGQQNGVEDWVGGSGGYGALYCLALAP